MRLWGKVVVGILAVVVVWLIVSAVHETSTLAHELNPVTNAERQFALTQAQVELAQQIRLSSQNEERWLNFWDMLATVGTYSIPILAVASLLTAMFVGLLFSSSWVIDRAVEKLDKVQFVAPYISRQAALNGETIHLAELQMHYQGQIGMRTAENPGRYLDLSSAPNLRSLHIRGGAMSSRSSASPLTQRPIEADPTPPTINRHGIVSLSDIGDSHDNYHIPYGVGPDGKTVWSSVVGRHRLIGGATGCGKTNLAQAHVLTLNKYNSPRSILNYFIDPKKVAFNKFKTDERTAGFSNDRFDALRVLEELETLRETRQAELRDAGYAEWYPGILVGGKPMPLLALWVDELGSVTDISENHKLLNSLIRQCRSAGITFEGLAQLTDTMTAVEQIRTNCIERACGFVPAHNGSVAILGRAGAEDAPKRPGFFTLSIDGEFIVVKAPHAGILPVPGNMPRAYPETPIPEPILNPGSSTPRPSDRDVIIDYINLQGRPVDKTELYREFGNSISQPILDSILDDLVREGMFEVHKEKTGMRGAPRILTGLAQWFTKED